MCRRPERIAVLPERPAQHPGGLPVTESVEVDAVECFGAGHHALGPRPIADERLHQIHEPQPPLARHLRHRVAIKPQRLVMLGRVGQGRGQLLMDDRRDEHHPRLRRFQAVEQGIQTLDEPRQARLARERLVHPVGENDHRRLELEHQIPTPLEPLLRRLEAGPGVAPDRIAGAAEVAEGDVAVGPERGQRGFEVAEFVVPLEESIADEDDPVAVLQLEPLRSRLVGSRQSPDRQQQTGQRDRPQIAIHDAMPSPSDPSNPDIHNDLHSIGPVPSRRGPSRLPPGPIVRGSPFR